MLTLKYDMQLQHNQLGGVELGTVQPQLSLPIITFLSCEDLDSFHSPSNIHKYSIHVQNLPFPFPFRLTERSIANSKVDIRQVAVIFLNP